MEEDGRAGHERRHGPSGGQAGSADSEDRHGPQTGSGATDRQRGKSTPFDDVRAAGEPGRGEPEEPAEPVDGGCRRPAPPRTGQRSRRRRPPR
jgi:hypothetical protein